MSRSSYTETDTDRTGNDSFVLACSSDRLPGDCVLFCFFLPAIMDAAERFDREIFSVSLSPIFIVNERIAIPFLLLSLSYRSDHYVITAIPFVFRSSLSLLFLAAIQKAGCASRKTGDMQNHAS